MTTLASAVLFRSESKGSGFKANERPQMLHYNAVMKVINGKKGIFSFHSNSMNKRFQ